MYLQLHYPKPVLLYSAMCLSEMGSGRGESGCDTYLVLLLIVGATFPIGGAVVQMLIPVEKASIFMYQLIQWAC